MPSETSAPQSQDISIHRIAQGQLPLSTAQLDTDWMEGENVRTYMSMQINTIVFALITIPIVFALLYGHVHTLGLLVWLVLTLLANGYRLWFTLGYTKNLVNADSATQLQFKSKYSWIYPVSSGLWGALVWLFYTKAPLFQQFICWATLASIGVFSVAGYSSSLKITKQFINTMASVMLAGIAWHYFANNDAETARMTYSIVPLLILLWGLLMLTGKRFNKSHLQRLQLIGDANKLINSLQEQTLRANQAIATKNRFLASAAHDIRQPVLALDMYANMLRTEPEMAEEITVKIEAATKSVINMFDSLFDLSRLEAGQLNIKTSQIDVSDLMDELELQYEPVAKVKNLELRLHSGDYKIRTDHQLLKRILGNLVMNAIKFTDKGGILLACRPSANGVRFEVWDTGIGIEADQQVAVFKEFYKSPSNLGTSDGFGLGLSIVARLCEALHLDFSMRSRVGRGSVFCIEVPRQALVRVVD